jgi:hypothetical protein
MTTGVNAMALSNAYEASEAHVEPLIAVTTPVALPTTTTPSGEMTGLVRRPTRPVV